MSKLVRTIPLKDIAEIELRVTNCRKTRAQVLSDAKERRPDCKVYLLNGGMWNPDGTPCVALKANGKMLSAPPSWSGIWGIAFDSADNITYSNKWEEYRNFLSCTSIVEEGKRCKFSYQNAQGGKRGRSAIGLSDGNLCLYCSQDKTADAKPPEALADELAGLGWKYAVMLDSGGSSMCSFDGKALPGDGRKVHNWIVVYVKKKEGKPVSDKKKVVLDPGHGAQSNNKSPDGAFSEPEFALDMAERMRAILTRHGVEVTLTRTGANNPTGKADTNDLAYRCNVANAISGLDLFVSLHTNASGTGWSDASGWSVYTSSAGVSAGRNIAANKVIARIREAGIATRAAALVHDRLYVLKNTTAPAMLIEHAFHTNKGDVALLNSTEHRKKLAVAQCRGILDYLGIAYDGQDSVSTDIPTKDTGVSDWAATAWQKATAKGIVDGTNPQGNVTREMLAAVLDRLGII